jgi:hypothetical protein
LKRAKLRHDNIDQHSRIRLIRTSSSQVNIHLERMRAHTTQHTPLALRVAERFSPSRKPPAITSHDAPSPALH